MPIKINEKLPAFDILSNENIFVMDESRAVKQDIRALKIVILNLMPTKIATETHLLRLLANSPLQLEIEFLRTKTHVSKNTSPEHLNIFYKVFDDVKDQKFDGLIITGAPVETMDFENVNYWEEIKMIMDWSQTHVTSTLHICWGAQAGLYHHFGVQKHAIEEKMSGVFEHSVCNKKAAIVRGFDDIFFAPHSRHTEVLREEIEAIEELEIVSESPEAGIYIVIAKSGKQIFVTGHSEYDPCTLKKEYERDLKKDPETAVMPKNYFPKDDPSKDPEVRWRSHANLLFSNWLNYYVYQRTPFDLNDIR